MKVFVDKHNLSLFYSLQLLFEKRLGHELYKPIGEEWFTEGYWKIAEPYGNNENTIKQFLGINSEPFANSPPLNNEVEHKDGIYVFKDIPHNTTNKGITLEAFKETKFDLIIATIPAHIEPFKKLIREYQPQAKFIFQSGNIYWDKQVDYSTVPNFMGSVKPFDLPKTCNGIFYHQEFDLGVFNPQKREHKKQMVSFVNILPSMTSGATYYLLKSQYPEMTFKSYGIGCDDGIIQTEQEIASIMNESMFGLQLKTGGDGFGHILYNWYASGKPVIVNGNDYQDKLGGELLVDGETCIDIDKHSVIDVIEKVRSMNSLEYEWMCQQSYQKFKDCVDYDKEEKDIRNWLDKLQ